MKLRTTYTVVTLEISESAYKEISDKLKEADYGHVFFESDNEILIDMTGIALKLDNTNEKITN